MASKPRTIRKMDIIERWKTKPGQIKLVEKWRLSGLLYGIEDEEQLKYSQALENLANHLISIDDGSNFIQSLATFIFPVTRRVLNQLNFHWEVTDRQVYESGNITHCAFPVRLETTFSFNELEELKKQGICNLDPEVEYTNIVSDNLAIEMNQKFNNKSVIFFVPFMLFREDEIGSEARYFSFVNVLGDKDES